MDFIYIKYKFINAQQYKITYLQNKDRQFNLTPNIQNSQW